jgi:hypothetical protein
MAPDMAWPIVSADAAREPRAKVEVVARMMRIDGEMVS